MRAGGRRGSALGGGGRGGTLTEALAFTYCSNIGKMSYWGMLLLLPLLVLLLLLCIASRNSCCMPTQKHVGGHSGDCSWCTVGCASFIAAHQYRGVGCAPCLYG